MVGASVPSSEGWVKINNIVKYKSWHRKYKIVTSIGTIIFDEKQHFFRDSNRTISVRFHVGDMIDTFYGKKKILKKVRIAQTKEVYVDIYTDNYIRNYYIHNGILTCR